MVNFDIAKQKAKEVSITKHRKEILVSWFLGASLQYQILGGKFQRTANIDDGQ